MRSVHHFKYNALSPQMRWRQCSRTPFTPHSLASASLRCAALPTMTCSSSCSARMALLTALSRAPCSSLSLPFLRRSRPCGRGLATEPHVCALPPCPPVLPPLPRSVRAPVFPRFHRSFSLRTPTPVAVRCRTLPRAVETVADIRPGDSRTETSAWKLKMLYDGECPLCIREVNMLRERNKSYGYTIKFVDICADDYAAEENSNIGFETAMGRIHAIRHDGEVLTNIAAFRALYEEVGLGWVYAISRYEPWASILDTVYEFWAKYRLPVTGRPPLAELLERRRQGKVEGGKSSADEKRCQLD